MALVSDDLALVDAQGRALLDEAIELGRANDAAAQAGRVATSPGLLEGTHPTALASGVAHLEVEGNGGTSRMDRHSTLE
jgi:hypothetical protein